MFVAISEYKRLNNENIKSGRFYVQSEKMDINTNGPIEQYMDIIFSVNND